MIRNCYMKNICTPCPCPCHCPYPYCTNHNLEFGKYYINIKNSVSSLQIFAVFKCTVNGKPEVQKSKIFGHSDHARIYFLKTSENRDLTIYKKTPDKEIFIFNTTAIPNHAICFEVQGVFSHTTTHVVKC